MIQRLFTIGVYGKTESEFFGKLMAAEVDVFCDIRRRRGVRGAQYAFGNSKHLQRALAERSVVYRYLPQLAPTPSIRETQRNLDADLGVAKRARQELGEEFKRRYSEEVLDSFDPWKFQRSFDSAITRVALFCVEANPAACHRSLVAERIGNDLGIEVEHL
jgi:uncharacterized protein (DUF488 family)